MEDLGRWQQAGASKIGSSDLVSWEVMFQFQCTQLPMRSLPSPAVAPALHHGPEMREEGLRRCDGNQKWINTSMLSEHLPVPARVTITPSVPACECSVVSICPWCPFTRDAAHSPETVGTRAGLGLGTQTRGLGPPSPEGEEKQKGALGTHGVTGGGPQPRWKHL